MRKTLEFAVLLLIIAACLVFDSWYEGRANAEPEPDFRDGVGAGVFVDSTVTSSGGVTTHVPKVSLGGSASNTSSLFTSSTSAIDFDTASSITTAFDLSEVYVNYSAASSTQSLLLKVNSGAGDEFDVTFLTSAVTTTATVFRPARTVSFRAVDSVRLIYPNANGDTVGAEIKYILP